MGAAVIKSEVLEATGLNLASQFTDVIVLNSLRKSSNVALTF